jgi:Interferon-induced transmembrane protein
MFCPQCGSQNSNNATTCAAGGAPLGNPYQSSMAGPGSFQPGSNIPSYLPQAILSTICCCLPFGIVAIVYAAQALRLNPLTVIMLPALLIVFVINSIAACRGSTAHWHRPRWMPTHWTWALVVLIIGFGVLRNIPYWPFTILVPH